MTDQPLLSVIIPVYKAERSLRRCVDSLLCQLYTNLEIWLVDDGSPDSSPAICDDYAARDRRVHVIHQPNQGAFAARNAGLDAAGGALIGFVDADDWLEPNMYETLYALLRDTAIALAGALLCRSGDGSLCGTCPACRKVLVGEHPDLMLYDPDEDKDIYKKESLRRLRAELYRTPVEAPRKVAILQLAERIPAEGQNPVSYTHLTLPTIA